MVSEMKSAAWIAVALIAVALIISGTLIALNWKTIQTAGKTIETAGDSKMEVSANKVSINIGYESRGSTAEIAQNDNKAVSARIIDALKKAGLKQEEIETVSYYVNPEYDWKDGEQKLKDYVAMHSLKITATEMDKVGSYIDAAMNAGANRVDSINYELTQDRQNELKAKALKEATESARAKAEAIASGSGTKIKKLVSIQDTSYDYNPWIYRVGYAAGVAEKAVEVPTQVETGKVTIQASVRTVFEID